MRTRAFVSIFVLCCVFGAGIFAGRASEEIQPVQTIQKLIQKIDVSESGVPYKFINPLLFCTDQSLSNEGANNLENIVGAYIAQEKNNGDLIDASFYFKDLNGGPSSLVNPDFRSLPSSLLKVPIAISIYKHAEQDPKFLGTKITFTKDANMDQSEHFQPPEKIQVDATYTIEDLVHYMLEDSDNAALLLLGNTLDLKELQNSYTHFGIALPTTNSKQGYTMDVKTYASFFRILYNGTYLSQDNSEHLLSLLAKSTFTQGLAAGLPQDMAVAHKFGEADSSDGTLQLHDCGIVYKPNQPYLICVMTKGSNFDTLAGVISHISKTVYQILQSQN